MNQVDGKFFIRSIPELDGFASIFDSGKYGIPEMFHWLQVRNGYTNVIYLDIESYVCDPLEEVTEALKLGKGLVVVSNPNLPHEILMLALSKQIDMSLLVQKWNEEGIQEFIRSVSNKIQFQQPRYQFSLGDDNWSQIQYISGQIYIGGERLALFHTQWIRDRVLDKGLSENGYQHLIYARKFELFLNQACQRIHKYRSIGGENPFLHSPIFLSEQARFSDRTLNMPLITPLMAMIWSMRSDLQAVFSDPWGYQRNLFCQWFVIYSPHEYQFTSEYIQPVQSSMHQWSFWNMKQKGR
ncbi:hypothetical protein [Paenibacillus guangzhouensis]|uniref:hypothetical protein n=1 Tax=Paenibacillus guangzhouensis TaxID=1473112 RepID=UPI00187B37C4|nr:hypothetical protein [Paenibacillus guangzhouensis]